MEGIAVKLSNKDIIEKRLIEIEAVTQHIKAVEDAASYVHRAKPHRPAIDCAALLSALHDRELSLWRDVFMFGLTLDSEEQDRIKAAGYERFLSARMHVAEYHTPGVSSYLTADDDEFRAMCAKLFAPK